MAKNLKINIKNAQIAQALNLGRAQETLKKRNEAAAKEAVSKKTAVRKTRAKSPKKAVVEEEPLEEMPRVRARTKSVFEEKSPEELALESPEETEDMVEEEAVETGLVTEEVSEELSLPVSEEPMIVQEEEAPVPAAEEQPIEELPPAEEAFAVTETFVSESEAPPEETEVVSLPSAIPVQEPTPVVETATPAAPVPAVILPKLGPTGRHVRDLLPPKRPPAPAPKPQEAAAAAKTDAVAEEGKAKVKPKYRTGVSPKVTPTTTEEEAASQKGPRARFKEFRDLKPLKPRGDASKGFDARDRQGLREGEEEQGWRSKRRSKVVIVEEAPVARPTQLSVRLPIRLKDLAAEMKIKSSELIAKLFLNGLIVTLNDVLNDETTVQLLGQDFGCEITIDTSEEKRIRITDQSIKEEIAGSSAEARTLRPPVVAFMGHVDHGKTSLIDAIRSSNLAASEAGAITQHMGAFRCHTPVGDITILDTPGHEAFSAMRARGADVTDIVVLVVAGDEGIMQQTVEAIQHAKAANVTIVVAINKCDKPAFDAERVYRQLADQNLLPEPWGGHTLTVNCSAVTKEGIDTLLETLALQAEVMELRANPDMRARGTVLESELHKGLGPTSTVLVQNGTLHQGDAVVFGSTWGRVKTMQDEFGRSMDTAGPSTPVEITGLSGLPDAGEEFIVVADDKEAKLIAEARHQELREQTLQKRTRGSMEHLFQQASGVEKKVLNVVLRADVQGSLEALRVALEKIESDKAKINIIFTGVGEISESDVQLAAASKAMILGFHTQVESHADQLLKQFGITVRLHDIIYHAIDDVKQIMTDMLDRIAKEQEKGKALVKATFKSSQSGRIAGCEIIEGSIHRNHQIRVMREGKLIWKGSISSIRRVKEDVREVAKGLECGIILNGCTDLAEGDILESYEITYIAQEL